jgi:predicted ATPase
MLNSLTLKNFKPFENQSFSLKKLTLISGLNSTGKSSLLQSLLLLRQSYQQDLLPDIGLALNGDLVCIGTAQDALFDRAEEDIITFEILADDVINQWIFKYDKDSDVMEILSSTNACNTYDLNIFTDKFYYIQAERTSPQAYFETSDFQVKQHQQIGSRGEFTAHFLSTYEKQKITDLKLSHPEAISLSLQNQVEAWIGEISPGTKIEIQSHSTMDLVSLQYSYGLSNPYRSTNVGFGITYTLPIIVSLLSAAPDTLILLENPEAHLHPKGQSKMGELLALAASCGIQIIVETHSDHVLNGIRRAVRHNQVNADDIQIHYFDRYLQSGKATTKIMSPRIYQDGGIDKWPDGFFDQAEKDLMELL